MGDDGTKDCYAEFFERVYEKMEGAIEKVPFDDNSEEEDLYVTGTIINHAFLQYSSI